MFFQVEDTNLDSLPNNIGYWQKVKAISISNNKPDSLFKLPTNIGYLNNLQVLRIVNTPLDTLPRSIGELKQIKIIDIKNCKLHRLPKKIGNNQRLCWYTAGGQNHRLLGTGLCVRIC